MRKEGVSPADVDAILVELSKRRLPLERVLAVLYETSVRQDNDLSYSLPELENDFNHALDIQRRAGGDWRAIPESDGAEYKSAVGRAFQALCEVLAIYNKPGGTLTLEGEDDDRTQMPADDNPGQFAAGLICAHIFSIDDDDPFEWHFEDEKGGVFRATIAERRVRFRGEIRLPSTHREAPQLSGYSGAIEKVREQIRRETERRGSLERLRAVISEARREKPELATELDALVAKLPPPLPTVAAFRPQDAFGQRGIGAAALKKLGLSDRLAAALLVLASRSHPLTRSSTVEKVE